MVTVIRVSTDHDRGRHSDRVSSNTTGNPRPPMITAALIGSSTHGSPTKPMRLSG